MQRSTRSLLALSFLLLLGIVALALMRPTPVQAATRSWDCGVSSGAWSDPNNWGGAVPTFGDTAIINCAAVAVTLNASDTINRLDIYTGTILTIGAGGSLTSTSQFNVIGATIIVNSGGSLTTTGDFYPHFGATLTINSGGSLTTGGGSIWDATVTVNGAYTINGIIDVTPAGIVTVNPSGTLIVKDTLDMSTGTLNLDGTLVIYQTSAIVKANLPIDNVGTLKGKGTVQADVVNYGHVHPGLSPGILTIAGSYTQTTSGVLDIEINGTTLGTQYSQLVVTGTATLSGTLSIQVGDFTPGASDSFQVGDFSFQSGDFSEEVVTGGTGNVLVCQAPGCSQDQGIWISSVTSDWKKCFLPLIRKR